MNLHLEAVPADLVKLLLRLMQDEQLAAFYLVGGTSLALRFGHRESVDIDLFTHEPFDAPRLAARLKEKHGLVEAQTAANSVNGIISQIKVDLMAHRYPLLHPIECIEGIRLASLADVAAMKLNAIANRGSKKDFWDCAQLLEFIPLQDLLQHAAAKYAGDSLWNIEKSLCYFDDAENEPDPRDLGGKHWEDIKACIRLHTRLPRK